MGYVGEMAYAYPPIPSDVVETIIEQETEVLKRLEEKGIGINESDEACSWAFDTDEPILVVSLGEQTTQRTIEKKRKMLNLT